jgi:cell division protein FtsA
MKDIFSIISITRSGKILMIVTGKDDSGKSEILAKKSCASRDNLISDVVKPVTYEVLEKSGDKIKEVIVALSSVYTNIIKNRGYLVRDSDKDDINESDLSYLHDCMFMVHPEAGFKVVAIAPLIYSVDDVHGIKSPIGICGKRLEGTFMTLFAEIELLDFINTSLGSVRINVKKFIPVTLSTAEPFLTFEEMESLSLLTKNQ